MTNGAFVSSDYGASWTSVNTGLPLNVAITSLATNGVNLYAGIYCGVVWRRPLSEMVTSVDGALADVPTRFTLDQNYPNPFNPTTTIQFNLSTKSKVRLLIFNLLGQQVAELANEEVNAGYLQKVWNANIPSGLYFCRLEAVSVSDPSRRFVDVKKIILLK